MPRLDQLVARHTGLSRRDVAARFRAGRITDPAGRPLAPTAAVELPMPIRVDGVAHTLVAHVHVLQHKPIGVVTAITDPQHATAWALLAGVPCHADLRPIGRLDRDTSGLLLWTTDGALLHRFTHPKFAVPRTYHAALSGPWREPLADLALRDGHRPRITDLRPLADPHPALVARSAHLATITITGGAYHEVRRIFAALGTEVVALARVSFGAIALPLDLPAGQHVPIALEG